MGICLSRPYTRREPTEEEKAFRKLLKKCNSNIRNKKIIERLND